MIAFDRTHNPPAPVIEVTIRNPLNRRLRRSLPALLDTGSDITAIPEAVRVALQLINNFVSTPIEVIETPLTFAVIGRDVLKHFNLHLYGREQIFELVAV